MDWINDVYKQGTLENKLAKKIWFLDSSRLFYLLEKDLGKQISKEFIETQERVTASEGMKKADILFGIDKHPQIVKMEDGTELETGSYAVVREPTSDDPEHKVLATVGKEWTCLQATELGKMLDPISEEFPIETVGAIGNGEKIFLSMDAGASTIAGEDHELYWLVADHRDGTGAMSIAFTPVRVVCQNTLITGLRSSKVSVNLRHNRSIQTDASFYLDIFNQMARTQENVVSAMDTMQRRD